MIVSKTRKDAKAIRQEDHAHFSAFILEHWNDHAFRYDDRHEEIIRATREHDNGWREFDKKPRLDAKTKLPVNFKKITPEEIFEIWERGSTRFLKDDPYVALMVTHHAYTLHQSSHGKGGAWKEFFVTLAKRRGKLRDELGLTHNDIEHAYSFLRMADWFSLMYCSNPKLGQSRPAQYAGYKVVRDGNDFLIRPFPFTEKDLSYELPVIDLDRSGYADEKSLWKDVKKTHTERIDILPLEL